MSVPAVPAIPISPAIPDVPPPLLRAGTPPWIGTVVACLCAFMVVMDGAIVNVALPAMQQDLDLSGSQLQWVVDSYLLLLGGCMLLAARAGDIYGRKSVLLWGLLCFTGASLAGGFALNGGALLIARAVQGFGAAALATSPLAVIMEAHPKGAGQERAIGWWAACAAMGSACGVVIGGALTSLISWRWVMFVNVPAGLLLMAMVMTCLNPRNMQQASKRLDVLGALTITLALGAFMFAISQSMHEGWGAASVRTAMGVALAAFGAFLWAERRAPDPLIRFSLFQTRNVPIGMVMIAGLGAILTTSTFFLSQALQRIDGRSALDTGLALLPLALALAVAAIYSRRLRDAGVRQLPFIGGVMSAAGLIWLYWLPAHPVQAVELLFPTLLVGAGGGLTMMSATHAVLTGVRKPDAGLVAGLQNTARQLGGAIGLAALVTLVHSVAGELSAAGQSSQLAELGGYQAAFLASGLISAISALASLMLRHRHD